MALIFDNTTGVKAEETATIRSRLANEWKQAFNVADDTPELVTDPETPAGQLIDGQAAIISMKDAELLRLANGFNPSTATGVYQDALAQIYFIRRKVAQPTYVTCICKGLQGTAIPFGAVVQDVDGNKYTNTVAGTIGKNGTYETIFACTVYGAQKVGAGAVNKIITVLPGWDSVTNEKAGVTGRERETQTEFEQRRYDSVSKNSHGLAASVGGSVANIEGVAACRVEQNRGDDPITAFGVTIPPHSIYLSVYGGDPNEIGRTIHMKLDAGCGTSGNTSVKVPDETNNSIHTYFFTVAEVQNLFVRVNTAPAADFNETTVKNAILENFSGTMQSYSRVKMGDTVYASRFYETVIAAGLNGLVSIEVGRSATAYGQSAVFNLNEFPVLDIANISFNEVTKNGG